MQKTKPFLKWAGNKFRCLDKILAALPAGNRLIEPFTGSGAIFLNSDYTEYLLAEQNNDLVMLFQCLQTQGTRFIDYCAQLFIPENNCAEKYYLLRAEFNQLRASKRRAALFLYLNRHGYNGLCRYNQQGLFNVPFGLYHRPYFPRNEMEFFLAKSLAAQFIKSDFRQTFQQSQPGDVIYCDPPYVPLSASANFSAYIGKKFTEQDQIDLVGLAIASAEKGCTVIISNHDTEFTRFHYRSGDIISFPVERLISCNGEKRVPVNELVAIFRG
ncbi:Dam family site-specific DNA-(adenine-N6)-methyltransferase [Legionella dresdenensis]|uniref:Site-specific DNA-methyltransferase (adenine-specific) n=1 Tax=Legionella dresdenensis TaxID=450200 RepID=A0ABV8CDS2_9GAMM